MAKVSFFDKRVSRKFLETTSVVSGVLSFVVIFVDIPAEWKLKIGLIFFGFAGIRLLGDMVQIEQSE